MAEKFRLDVVVLAGGGGRRLGGTSKADLTLHGRRLLDHLLDDLAAWADPVAAPGTIVVVAPASVAVPAGVLRVLEDPPGGGPAAGIAAAVESLGAGDLVAVVTCDAPRAVRALPELIGNIGPDGAVVSTVAGFDEFLLGVYRFAALRRRVAEEDGARDISARRLLGVLDLTRVRLAGDFARDVDTWEDLRALEEGA